MLGCPTHDRVEPHGGLATQHRPIPTLGGICQNAAPIFVDCVFRQRNIPTWSCESVQHESAARSDSCLPYGMQNPPFAVVGAPKIARDGSQLPPLGFALPSTSQAGWRPGRAVWVSGTPRRLS
mmetsp:Transcript_3916/g.7165  ORF Transcript_3916/g.7165 Transcript_3916/m.7165 type:complete len:123 (+) Transcript_3916:116-484(+)